MALSLAGTQSSNAAPAHVPQCGCAVGPDGWDGAVAVGPQGCQGGVGPVHVVPKEEHQGELHSLKKIIHLVWLLLLVSRKLSFPNTKIQKIAFFWQQCEVEREVIHLIQQRCPTVGPINDGK